MTAKEKAKAEKVEKIMRLLECTEEEALDVIRTDEIIDKGGRTEYDLSKEQEKIAMKISAVDIRRAKDQSTNMRGKVRAENPTKADLIQFLYENLQNYDCNNLKITNKERMIAFSVGENDFEITLTQKRKKKS